MKKAKFLKIPKGETVTVKLLIPKNKIYNKPIYHKALKEDYKEFKKHVKCKAICPICEMNEGFIQKMANRIKRFGLKKLLEWGIR